jgi:hypothetical protein
MSAPTNEVSSLIVNNDVSNDANDYVDARDDAGDYVGASDNKCDK